MKKHRHEYKYVVTEQQLALVKNRIGSLCLPDPNTGPDGTYRVRSLYFDDRYNSCYYENENGTDPREKFRIRIYPENPESISLELKRKEKGKTLKQSCPISAEECRLLMSGEPPAAQDGRFLLKKLCMLMRTRGMSPRIIVEYERRPFISPLGNVRITFDRNIALSRDFTAFLEPTLALRPIMPPGEHILEVKFDEFLPDPIRWAVALPGLQHTAFSKFYLCARFGMPMNGSD